MAAFRIRLQKVIGTGTTLDTARLRYLLGDYLTSTRKCSRIRYRRARRQRDGTLVASFRRHKSIMSIVENNPDRFKLTDLDEIAKDVTGAAQK